MQIYAGTSGYSYKEWLGVFYPEKLAAAKMLGFYAGNLPAVEINNTFYRFPSENALGKWASQTPEGFLFAVKANQRITHRSRLKNVEQVTHEFPENRHSRRAGTFWRGRSTLRTASARASCPAGAGRSAGAASP